MLDVITHDFLHIIKKQALNGRAVIRSQNPIFKQPEAINICLDLFSERGFRVVLDVFKEKVPSHVDLQTGKITCEVRARQGAGNLVARCV